MSATAGEVSVAFTVYDSDHLPAGMYSDDVTELISDVVEKAMAEWYAAEGHRFLACEPTVG